MKFQDFSGTFPRNVPDMSVEEPCSWYSDKTKILQATIWLDSMDDFAEMNAVWDAWVPEGHTPARACGESKLATPEYKVEIIVVAAA